MKGRGNYSWTFPEVVHAQDRQEDRACAAWARATSGRSCRNDYDKSLLRNSLAGYVGSKLNGMAWTPKSVPVDFYLNGYTGAPTS